MSVPNLKWIALFVKKLLGSQHFETGSVIQATPIQGSFIYHTQAGSVLHPYAEFEVDCSMRSKVIKGSLNSEIRSRPFRGRFMVLTQGGSVLYVCTKFEADSSFRSKVIRGSQMSPRRRPPSRGAGRPKFNQLESVTTFSCKPSLVKVDARNVELSW